ncbi:hypothetical protein HWV62_3891 [Athelia sp. TMB]|nr:hypothetical protein HWV62_3891 [Athelia sp. TMB]
MFKTGAAITGYETHGRHGEGNSDPVADLRVDTSNHFDAEDVIYTNRGNFYDTFPFLCLDPLLDERPIPKEGASLAADRNRRHQPDLETAALDLNSKRVLEDGGEHRENNG